MARYIDGFVVPLRHDQVDEYERVAKGASEIYLEHGALEYHECLGDDLQVHCGRSFPDLAGLSEAETVMFAYVVYESREARDAANEKIMADPRMAELFDLENPPFDLARMGFGGFKSLVHAQRD